MKVSAMPRFSHIPPERNKIVLCMCVCVFFYYYFFSIDYKFVAADTICPHQTFNVYSSSADCECAFLFMADFTLLWNIQITWRKLGRCLSLVMLAFSLFAFCGVLFLNTLPLKLTFNVYSPFSSYSVTVGTCAIKSPDVDSEGTSWLSPPHCCTNVI